MKLSDFMASRGLKDEGMAELIGCGRPYIVKLRAGKIPSPEMIAIIREKTGGAVQPNDWFDGQEEAA